MLPPILEEVLTAAKKNIEGKGNSLSLAKVVVLLLSTRMGGYRASECWQRPQTFVK